MIKREALIKRFELETRDFNGNVLNYLTPHFLGIFLDVNENEKNNKKQQQQ